MKKSTHINRKQNHFLSLVQTLSMKVEINMAKRNEHLSEFEQLQHNNGQELEVKIFFRNLSLKKIF
jgi:hypothetical protein